MLSTLAKSLSESSPARIHGAYTPWGESHLTVEIAPGILFYSTPSHGGAFVPPDIRADWPAALRDCPTYAGGNWYEEDCDVVLIILAHPDGFTASEVAQAVHFARTYCRKYAPGVWEWIHSSEPHAEKLRDIAALYRELNPTK